MLKVGNIALKVCLASETLRVRGIESLPRIRDILQFPVINISAELQMLSFAEKGF